MQNEKGAAALSDLTNLLQLWDALGSKLIEAAQGQLPSNSRLNCHSVILRLN